MTHTRLWISAAIIAFVILVAFALSVLHTRDLGVKSRDSIATTSVPTVALHDAYKKGMHTISGSIKAPNACTPVSATASLIGDASSTESILVVVTLQTDSGVCLQLPTNVSFQTTLTAPANISISATINGSPASTTPL